MDLLKLKATLGLDSSEYRKGLGEAEDQARGFGSKFKRGFATAAKAGVAAVGAATTAVGVLVKKSVDGYAQYQQMTGGVKKLYGNMGLSLEDYAASVGKSVDEVQVEYEKLEKAQNMVMENAKNAFKTTGMSANQYMETATSFSASLINALGGDTIAAAEKTDVAMKAIADNWNTFGGDIGMIQYAFQGFAKQNYTMLDNLKLGYGGSAAEMVRLIKDSGVLGDAADELTAKNLKEKVSFDQIVDAIQAVQEQQHIAGTTAREGATTIEGSMMAVRAAWENLITGFADPDADIAQLVEDVVSNATTAAQNMIPTIMQAISGVGNAMTVIIPKLIEELPKKISEVGVPMLETGTKMVLQLVEGMVKALPKVVEFGEGLVKQVTGVIDKFLPMIMDKGPKILADFSGKLREGVGKLVDVGLSLVLHIAKGIISGIPSLIENIPTIINNLAGIINDNAPKIIATGVKIIGMLIVGLIKAIPTLIVNIPKILIALVNAFLAFNWLSLGRQIILSIGKGILSAGESLVGSFLGVGESAGSAFKGIPWSKIGRAAINAIKNGVLALRNLIPNALRSLGSRAMKAFVNLGWGNVGINIVKGIAKGIIAGASTIVTAAKNAAKSAFEKAKEFLGINSPSKLFRDVIGRGIAEGMALGIEDNEPIVTHAMDDLDSRIVDPYSGYDFATVNEPQTYEEVETTTQTIGIPNEYTTPREDPKDVTVILELDRMQLAKTVFKLNKQETQRMGVRLSGGYA